MDMKNILVLGNRGYIGSYLCYAFSKKYNITGIDIGWFDKSVPSIDYRTLSKQDLKKFDIIILLAGHSSVRMCEGDLISSFKNNVVNFVELLTKVGKQKLIYASS